MTAGLPQGKARASARPFLCGVCPREGAALPFARPSPLFERGGRHETLVHRGGVYGSFCHCHDGGKSLGSRAIRLGAPRRALVGLRAKLMGLAAIPFSRGPVFRYPGNLPPPGIFRPLPGRVRPGRGRKWLRPPSTPPLRGLSSRSRRPPKPSPSTSLFSGLPGK